jgi:hypothetical protein
MSKLNRTVATLGKRAKLVLVVLLAVVVFWAIVHRLVFAFTPPWLDLAVAIAGGVAALALWLLGRASTFDYSAPIKKSRNARSGEHEA